MSLLKYVPNRKKKLVHGYIHEMEKELKMMSIPMIIISKCILYTKDAEYFVSDSKIESCKHIKLTNNKLTISTDGLASNNMHNVTDLGAFCHQLIDINKYKIAKWKLKIDYCDKRQCGVAKGIRICLWGESKVFGLLAFVHCSGKIWIDGRRFGWINYDYKYLDALPFNEGDVVEFVADFVNKQIYYTVNGKNQKITDIPSLHYHQERKYRLKIQTDTRFKSSVSIVDFCAE